METTAKSPDDERQEHPVEIRVNKKHVTMPTDDVTGQQIIDAAITQGVEGIQRDFVLSIEIGPDKYQVVGKDDPLEIRSGSVFIANAPDDNS